jgi:putative oxidoreductase
MNHDPTAARRYGLRGVLNAGATLYAALDGFPSALLALIFRIAVAAVFWKSGLTKLPNWDATVFLFAEEYKVPLLPPEVAAYLAVILELSCPVLLVLGLLTRPAAAALLGMTLVIQIFVYPLAWSEHLLWAALLLFLVTRGPGALSLDHWLGRLLGGQGIQAPMTIQKDR